MLNIPAEILRALEAHGEAAYPNEGAGLLLGLAQPTGKTVTTILPLANRWESEEQFHRFLLSPQDMLQGEQEAARLGVEVIGVFHSHPDHPAEPSGFDRDWAWPWYSYIITSIQHGRAVVSRSWLLQEDRSAFMEEAIETSLVEAN